MHFDPMPASQLNHQNTIAPGIAVRILRSGPNYFHWKHGPATGSPPRVRASAIFIQRSYGQASLLAKSLPLQPTRFKFRNQCLGIGTAAPPPHHSHFAHESSAPLNAAVQQGALLRRIPLISKSVITDSAVPVPGKERLSGIGAYLAHKRHTRCRGDLVV
jgi:hypothetical protein